MKNLFFLLVLVGINNPVFADDHIMKVPSELEWKVGPPTLPGGAKMTVLAGDPGKKGPFTMRLQFPANYKIPAHWHSQDENVTVIEGELYMGAGNKLDEPTSHQIPVTGFAMMPKKYRHFAFTKEQTAIVQIHGQGPFDIHYVNPADDPQKKK
jgi:hypothetical protein